MRNVVPMPFGPLDVMRASADRLCSADYARGAQVRRPPRPDNRTELYAHLPAAPAATRRFQGADGDPP